jgi:hypothetical protein
MKIKRYLKAIPFVKSLREVYYEFVLNGHISKFEDLEPGSADWLIAAEGIYGGRVDNLERNTKKYENKVKHIGGDRMLHHRYAKYYAKYLKPFIGSDSLTVIEVGILQGTGLAIWCELFPKASVIGFDIDLSYYRENLEKIERLGAFKNNRPIVHEFDQFKNNTKLVQEIAGNSVNICIDDGHHSIESIIQTIKSFAPMLSKRFVYFVEDNSQACKVISNEFPAYSVHDHGQLTVITPKDQVPASIASRD